MEDGWTMIYSSNQSYEIEIMQGMLSENDIQSVIMNKKDSFYLFGEIELYVKVDDAFRANQLIEKHSI